MPLDTSSNENTRGLGDSTGSPSMNERMENSTGSSSIRERVQDSTGSPSIQERMKDSTGTSSIRERLKDSVGSPSAREPQHDYRIQATDAAVAKNSSRCELAQSASFAEEDGINQDVARITLSAGTSREATPGNSGEDMNNLGQTSSHNAFVGDHAKNDSTKAAKTSPADVKPKDNNDNPPPAEVELNMWRRGSNTITLKPKSSVSPTHNADSDDKQRRISASDVKRSTSEDASMSPASTGKASAKQSRGSNSPIKHEVKLYGDLPDATVEATSTFEVINDCIYSNKWLGDSGQDLDMMICECRDEFVDGVNHACGENSDCINRLTLMECVTDDCGCQGECQNQRFQKRDYAQVSVFKTENKGYGLRADVDIPRGRFIYEYIGEVIGENSFRTRNSKYPGMGIKHFYFMSLERDQFIDATIKGSIARFVNHSCNPNCETEKWVVGNKFRMGIFAKRDIKAGEELAFDYNVDRYGADKVECFCGEPNCLGYIGGKTQTGGPAQISDHLRDALGIDDDDEDEDGNDIPATKKGRKKRIDADDGEFLINAGKKPLSINGVSPVMTQLTSSKEKWIVSKLIARIQNCDDEAVLTRVLQFRPYFVIGKFLTTYKDDDNIILSILATFMNLPRITKNKITVSGIEPKIEELTSHPNEEIASKAKELLQMWSALETSYRIPRRVANDNPEQINTVFLDRARDSRSTSRTESPKRSPKEPIPHWLANKNKHQNPFNKHQGPQNFTKQPPRGPRADRERGGNQFNSPARFGHRPRPFDNPNMIHSPQGRGRPTNHVELPRGWYKCYQQDECYYYSNDGQSTYDLPTQPCTAVGPPTSIPPPPSKRGDANDKVIQQLIQEVTANAEAERRRKDEEAQEKERAERRAKRKERDGKVYDKEKTEKYLAISFAKHVPTMVNKYKLDLGSSPKSQKESVKRYSKTIVGLLVDKEMRYHDKIVNPLNVCDTESKVAKVKLFVYEYMEKVIAHRKSTKGDAKTVAKEDVKRKHEGAQDGDSPRKRPIKSEDIEMNDASIPSSATISGTEDNATRPTSPSPKRKRDQRDIDFDTADTSKRHKATDLPNDRSSDQPSDRPSDNHDRNPSDQLDIESEPKIESSRVSITNGAA